MCANYEPISKDPVHLLNLFEPTFEYSNDFYPDADCPLLFSNEGNVEWRQVKFSLVPTWAKDLKICRKTYNARTETVHEKPSFRHAWKNSQFALTPVDTIYEPKYINGKAHWYGIYCKDGIPFTVAAHEDLLIQIQKNELH